MAFGTKTNERPGTRAQVKYLRVSAYKAREVLNLIRDVHVSDADQILQFVERDVAIPIRKCLASAVANAENNDSQDPEALFVSACFADEGPTLKRWRPRARGRATRIRKRTCHVTIIVSRLPEVEIRRRAERETAAQAATGGRRPTQSQAATRRARVARSRQRERQPETHDHDQDHADEPQALEPDAPNAGATPASIEAEPGSLPGSGDEQLRGDDTPIEQADQPVNVEGPVVELAEPPADVAAPDVAGPADLGLDETDDKDEH